MTVANVDRVEFQAKGSPNPSSQEASSAGPTPHNCAPSIACMRHLCQHFAGSFLVCLAGDGLQDCDMNFSEGTRQPSGPRDELDCKKTCSSEFNVSVHA